MIQIDLLFKLAGLGVAVTAISQILNRAGREELGTLTTVAGLIIGLFLVVNLISELLSSLKSLFSLY